MTTLVVTVFGLLWLGIFGLISLAIWIWKAVRASEFLDARIGMLERMMERVIKWQSERLTHEDAAALTRTVADLADLKAKIESTAKPVELNPKRKTSEFRAMMESGFETVLKR